MQIGNTCGFPRLRAFTVLFHPMQAHGGTPELGFSIRGAPSHTSIPANRGIMTQRCCAGQALRGGGYFIVMEYLEFRGRPSQRDLGRGLARMHLAEPSVRPCLTNPRRHVTVISCPAWSCHLVNF